MEGFSQKIKQEVFDSLNLNSEIQSGNDDIVYGRYIEWPELKELDDGEIELLAEIFDIVVNRGTQRADLEELIEDAGYSSGTEYEEGNPDFLVSEKYWQLEEDDYLDTLESDYDMYVMNFTILENITFNLEDIKDKINKNDDDLIKKSLILSAFIYTESYIKKVIGQKISGTDIDKIDVMLQSILKSYISKNLRTSDGRAGLFKRFFNSQLPQIPNIELRNALAHDLESPELKNDEISYEDKNGRTHKVSIIEIFHELNFVVEKIESIAS